MVRVSLILAAFLAVTIGIAVMQPGSARRAADTVAPEVTRGGADLAHIAAPKAEADLQQAQAEEDDLLRDAMRLLVVPAPDERTAVPEPEPEQTPSAAPVEQAATSPAADTGRAAATDGAGLEQMILGALRQGQSEDYIDAMVNDAADTGAVDVPSTFLTAEGRVDTSSILSALSAPAGPRIPESYTVGMGDTLAAISYRFYGTLDRQADIRRREGEAPGARDRDGLQRRRGWEAAESSSPPSLSSGGGPVSSPVSAWREFMMASTSCSGMGCSGIAGPPRASRSSSIVRL